MSLGKKLFIGGDTDCTTDSVQPFGAESAYSSNVALYQLDGNANDTVGNYNGTASNVTYSTGKYGNAAVFNGSSSYIFNSNRTSTQTTTITLSAWVNTTDTTSSMQILQTESLWLRANQVWRIDNANGTGAYRRYEFTQSTIATGNWVHVCVVRDGNSVTLYVNNSAVSFSSETTSSNSGVYDGISIGARNRSSDSNKASFFDGKIDQVRIYDKALSSDEVSILYNETTSTASDTNVLGEGSGVALYTLDYDASDAGGNYNGTPTDVAFGVDGQINYGASFNGTSSKITLPTGSPFNDSNTIKSISGWIKPDTLTNRVFLYSHSSSTNASDYFYVGYFGDLNRIYVAVRNGSSSNQNNRYANVTLNSNWNHIVAQLNGSTVEIWLNGVKQTVNDTISGSATSSSWIDYPTYDSAVVASIGIQRAYDPNYSTGLIDQVRLFKKALSSDEISTLYAETACVYTSTTDEVLFPSSASSNIFAYYKLDGSGEDESSNNHDGTEGSSMAYSFGRFGTAGSFDGSNNAVITIPDSDKFSPAVNDFSVSFWFNTSSTATNRLIAKGSNPYEWEMWISNGQPVYVGYASGGASHGVLYGGSNPGIYADGNWHHIVVTHDYGTKMEMFVDNVSIGSLTTFTGYGMSNTTSTVTIGKRGDQSTSMIGMLDQIRFYDKILTTDEIEELYNEKQDYITKNASDPFGDNSEVAFYEFENNANDSTGSNDGTPASQFVSYTSGVGLFGTYALYGRGSGGITNTSLGTAFRGQTTLSLSAWFNGENTTYRQTIFSFSDTNDGSTDLWIGIVAGNNTLGFRNVNNGSNNLQVNATGGSNVMDGKWHHVVFTADSGGTHIYVDGVELTGFAYSFGNSSTNIVMPNDLNQFNIGVNEDSTGFEWEWNDNHHISGHDGYLDQIRVFNRALDGDEVFQLWAEHIN